MLNAEKYKDELLGVGTRCFAVTMDGRIESCHRIKCKECRFSSHNNDTARYCGDLATEWLFAEAKEGLNEHR